MRPFLGFRPFPIFLLPELDSLMSGQVDQEASPATQQLETKEDRSGYYTVAHSWAW